MSLQFNFLFFFSEQIFNLEFRMSSDELITQKEKKFERVEKRRYTGRHI